MSGIPSKCPKCGSTKPWKEEVNAFTSGVPAGGMGRIRIFAPRGLLAKPAKKVMGRYHVTYRCHKCGFKKEYELSE